MPCLFLSDFLRRCSHLTRWLGAAALLLAFGACGGGGGMSGGGSTAMPQGCSTSTCGTAMMTLTDATGDFTSYTVDVTSINLTKKDGTVVETLPATTRVDFTRLVDLTELVTAATIPQGEYVSATMSVDYTNAAVFVEVNGAPVQATTVDGSGKPLGVVALTVTLDSAHHFFVNPGAIARLALDFNLAASNTVDTTRTPPLVTVQPFIVATVVPSDTKDIRVRGTLASVDTMAATFTVNLRPFDNQSGSQGAVVVDTTSTTTFEINGAPSTGAAGITALSAVASGAWVVAFGTLSTTDHSFTATKVLAGTSVEMPSMDGLIGVVTARTGDVLTVHGATVHSHGDGFDRFSIKNVMLTIASGTGITVDGQPNAMPTLAWLSVGSAITAFGMSGTDSSGNPTFDATSGRVRLEVSSVWGFPAATATGQVTLNVQSFDGLAPTAFNFAGTGTATASDSKPAMYVVTTGTLPLPAVSATSAVRYLGLVQPFGSAPPDFNANTQVDFSGTFSRLDVGFGMGSMTAFSTLSATELVLNLTDPMLSGAHLTQGPQIIDMTKLAASPPIVPNASGPDLFAIEAHSGSAPSSINVYQSFTDFESALMTKLTGTTKVSRIVAIGSFDQTTNTFTASQIGVSVSD